jgi:transcription-repair coupling factor (superfamily II helicase)
MNEKTITSVSTATLSYLLTDPKDKRSKIIITPDTATCEKVFNSMVALSNKDQNIYILPEWDSTPEYQNSPDIEVQAQRTRALYAILNNTEGLLIVTPINAITQHLVPVEYIRSLSKQLFINSEININSFSLDLVSSGYERTDIVNSVGQFSVKGNIIDVFSPSQTNPVRIELFGDSIDTIKIFDQRTQRTISKVQTAKIIPARELSLSTENVLMFKERFKEHCDKNHVRKDIRDQIIEIIDNNVYFPGMEYYLPFFHKKLSRINDYLDPEQQIILYDQHLFQESTHYKKSDLDLGQNIGEFIPYPLKDLYIEGPFWQELDKNRTINSYSIDFIDDDTAHFSLIEDLVKHNQKVKEFKHHGSDSIEKLKKFHKETIQQGYKLVYTCRNEHQAERLIFILGDIAKDIRVFKETRLNELIHEHNHAGPSICISDLSEGFVINSEKLWLVTEDEIFGEKQKKIEPSKTKDVFLDLFKELKLNDYVVHTKHGVGIYRGLIKAEIDGIESDYFQIEYSQQDLLLLPVHRLNSVQRYIAQGSHKVILDKLGGSSWDKKKKKAKKATMDIAQKLIKLQAERAAKKGFAFSRPDDVYYKFESEFEYEETQDQLNAINDVMTDMESVRPMDRLVCGDVGFGKTEVAIRAAFKCAKDGKQTAILTPTTVLAFQHYRIFQKRFKDYPVNIDLLTRFKSTKEQNETLLKLKEGKVDIIIGTHRLLSKDIDFKDLGLLIIDEEHRFGVKQKEKIKEIAKNVDIITLTATPIPRTLNMSLIGLKDVSIITTPPVNRSPIKTFVSKFSPKLISKAINYELKRGGQVFFLHNRVQDLEELYNKLKDIVPEAKIIMAHGQMDSKDLEQKMISFYNKEADVLVCTSIIESGIDIPNANTIIINRADMFGLSQLYQIRGRVGRSTNRAFCYLLVPSNFMIGKSAIERIKTLQRFTELGSGFNIASYDLEFRGAGEVLGSSQSGFIDDIGLDEYLKLIQESVEELKGATHQDQSETDTEIAINIPAFIPETYISDIGQRLLFYKKLSSSLSIEELFLIQDELKDRYGSLPEEASNLFSIMELKIMIKPLNVNSIKIGAGKLVYSFNSNTKIMPETIVKLVTERSDRYRITPDMKLISNIDDNDWRSAIKEIRNFIQIAL